MTEKKPLTDPSHKTTVSSTLRRTQQLLNNIIFGALFFFVFFFAVRFHISTKLNLLRKYAKVGMVILLYQEKKQEGVNFYASVNSKSYVTLMLY